MATYRVIQYFTGAWAVEVEANSPEEAKALGEHELGNGEGWQTDWFEWLDDFEVQDGFGEIEVN